MATREETARVLARHADELQNAWHEDAQELSALLTYVVQVSDLEYWKQEIKKADPATTLLFFGGRIPQQGINDITTIFYDAMSEASCFITESPTSCTLNPIPFNAQEFADALLLRGWHGPISYDLVAENTGDQATALANCLESLPRKPQTLVVAASIDHLGRMTAVTLDTLETRGLLSNLRVIPLALGAWSDIHRAPFTCEELAFANEHASKARKLAPEEAALQANIHSAGSVAFAQKEKENFAVAP